MQVLTTKAGGLNGVADFTSLLAIQPDWIIATGSIGSTLLALALALGLKDWVERPRVELLHDDPSLPDGSSHRIVTKRLSTGEPAAFIRLRVENRGRSTARRVGVRILRVHEWDERDGGWLRSRPDLDGRALQPSNQLAGEPDMVDVFPASGRILDLVSAANRDEQGVSPLFVEISHPWPPNNANRLEPGSWLLELLVCGDNIGAQRYFLALTSDGAWVSVEDPDIWDHIQVGGPQQQWFDQPPSIPWKADTGRATDVARTGA